MTDARDKLTLSRTEAEVVASQGSDAGYLIAVCFTVSMLLSALLLFFVQPMFAKMALPLLGGSSGVWNTAMVFFQAVLLGGYLYAHLLSKYLPFRLQVLVHGLVMSSAMFILPIAVPQGWEVPATGTPTLWLLGLFGAALGGPFFALSANAPLLQKWFSYTNHRSAGDPYFLYAASNAGSLLSLLCYPVIVEPFFRLSDQSFAWAVGFAVLIAMILGSGLFAQRFLTARESEAVAPINQGIPLNWKRRAKWVGYAILPSSLMLGVTAHLTSNVASAPFLWVLPLALYLLTFIVAFSPRPFLPFRLVESVFPYVCLTAIVLISLGPENFFLEIIGNLTCFYLIAQMCHNRLAKDRPAPENLTEFYFFMSLGGVIGGAMTALAAPLVFNEVYEYHLGIALAGFVAVGLFPARRQLAFEGTAGMVGLAGITAFVMVASELPEFVRNVIILSLAMGIVASVHYFRKMPVRLFLTLLAAGILTVNIQGIFLNKGEKIIFADRSFFGVSKVIYKDSDYGPVHIFQHGNTKHNVQLRKDNSLDYPLAYYSPGGSFGQTVDAVRLQKPNMSVAVVGLGAGAMACHVRENENWKFYEIDPLVVEMARNDELFTYVNRCAPDSPIVIGDARLTLQKEQPAKFDLIMIDAFSSDAIPAHLITKEALSLYRSKLKEGGYIFFHTSNRNLDVSSVVLNIAEDSGLASRAIFSIPSATTKYKDLATASKAVLVGDDDAALDVLLEGKSNWQKTDGSELVGVWRDDFSHILGALMANFRGE